MTTDNGSAYKYNLAENERIRGSKKRARRELAAHPLRYLAPAFLCCIFCSGIVYGCVIAYYACGDAFPFSAAAWFVCFPVVHGAFGCCADRVKKNVPLWRVFGGFCGMDRFRRSFENALFSACAFTACLAPAAAAAYLPRRLGADARTALAFGVGALFLAFCGGAYGIQLICEKRMDFRAARFYASFAPHALPLWLTGGLWSMILIPYAGLSYSFYKEDQK